MRSFLFTKFYLIRRKKKGNKETLGGKVDPVLDVDKKKKEEKKKEISVYL